MQLYSGPVTELVFICAAYALGCVSTGYYLVRLRTGQDIRTLGSRSTGSTNVGRILGVPGFIGTLLGDIAKGSIALWAALHFGIAPWGVTFVMIAVMLGHIWPVQLGFRGGKGLATILGIGMVLDYQLTLIIGIMALSGLFLGFGTASVLGVVVISPAVAAFMRRQATEVTGLVAIVLLILIAHRANIRAFFAARRGKKGMQA
jgi:glycerol-3-phosphate acyltransferase PlsY